MSNRIFLAAWVLVIVLAGSSFAVSIRVLPGGIPVGSAEQLMREGIRLGSSQMLRQAWDSYEKAVALNPEYLEGYLQLGRIFFHLSLLGTATAEESRKAQHFADVLLEKAPEIADAHRLMGMVLSGKGAYLDALQELQLALHLNPGNEFVICDLASIHLALKQPEQTIGLLEGRSLRDGWSYYILGMAWLQKGERGRAMLNFKKARALGFSGYWLDLAFQRLGEELSLPLR
ncbi:MAG: hypothetical protein OZSIB_0851 [Candidatus Ozemobacter sibiricus]|jgi:tetratricopeptide (TPR) repeat protein|uniref:Uncharacterized protein n=1 Tax=Candidatus Ozemobacter sibiricus TaxID=2268124 RepID=A0A367ZV50_9BACT|nr:MAG: hypothetical protein OZSIB_0851 [Candidatus Ozemobacter sibiricus]